MISSHEKDWVEIRESFVQRLNQGKRPEEPGLTAVTRDFIARGRSVDRGLIAGLLAVLRATKDTTTVLQVVRTVLGDCGASSSSAHGRDRAAELKRELRRLLDPRAARSKEARILVALLRADELMHRGPAARRDWSRWALALATDDEDSESAILPGLRGEAFELAVPAAREAGSELALAKAIYPWARHAPTGTLRHHYASVLRRLWQVSRTPWAQESAAQAPRRG